MIVSIGNLGGFFGPSLIGYVRQSTGGFMAQCQHFDHRRIAQRAAHQG
jgi:nitrate/nitrite transporter NarK